VHSLKRSGLFLENQQHYEAEGRQQKISDTDQITKSPVELTPENFSSISLFHMYPRNTKLLMPSPALAAS